MDVVDPDRLRWWNRLARLLLGLLGVAHVAFFATSYLAVQRFQELHERSPRPILDHDLIWHDSLLLTFYTFWEWSCLVALFGSPAVIFLPFVAGGRDAAKALLLIIGIVVVSTFWLSIFAPFWEPMRWLLD